MDAVAADENHTTAGQRSDDDDDEEDDDDDNDSDNDSDDRGGVGGASAGGGHGAKAESSSGFLTDSLMNEASLLQATISISVTSKTKRSERDDEGDVESDMQTNPKRVKFEESKKPAGSMLSSSSATKGGGSKTGSVSGAQLTDEYMRNYIRERGGKVTHDELKDVSRLGDRGGVFMLCIVTLFLHLHHYHSVIITTIIVTIIIVVAN